MIRHRLVALFLFICLSIAGTGHALAAPGTVILTRAEYRQMVADSLKTVREIKDQPAADQSATLDRLAVQWQAVDRVRLPNGRILPINHSYIPGLLRADPPDLDRVESALRALDQALGARLTAPTNPGDLQKLENILAAPEFQWAETAQNPQQTIWDRLWDLVAGFLDWLFSGVGGIQIGFFGIQYLLVFCIGIILLVVLVLVGRWLARSFVSDAESNDEEDSEANLNVDEAMRRANSLSEGGDYRAAIRYLYLASLLWLDEHGLMRYDRTRTNREYLRSVAGMPQLAQPLGQVIDLFDRVWYGFQKPDEEEYRLYRDHVEELRKQKQ